MKDPTFDEMIEQQYYGNEELQKIVRKQLENHRSNIIEWLQTFSGWKYTLDRNELSIYPVFDHDVISYVPCELKTHLTDCADLVLEDYVDIVKSLKFQLANMNTAQRAIDLLKAKDAATAVVGANFIERLSRLVVDTNINTCIERLWFEMDIQ